MKAAMLLLLIMFFSSFSAAATPPGPLSIQEIPTLPETSSFWAKKNCVLITADALAKSGDMLFTMKNEGKPGFVENDPLARPFVRNGPVVAGFSQGLLFAGEVFTSYELHKHGHPRMAKAVLLLGIGGNSMGMATSTH
jgi:hypothetical protein